LLQNTSEANIQVPLGVDNWLVRCRHDGYLPWLLLYKNALPVALNPSRKPIFSEAWSLLNFSDTTSILRCWKYMIFFYH